MAFTTTSNFSGKAAGFYISQSLKEAKSLEYLTMIENIKFKSNIQKQALSGVLADATCDFTGCWNSCNDRSSFRTKKSTS
jgi:ABC-type molybdate transport system substrate-binding protein